VLFAKLPDKVDNAPCLLVSDIRVDKPRVDDVRPNTFLREPVVQPFCKQDIAQLGLLIRCQRIIPFLQHHIVPTHFDPFMGLAARHYDPAAGFLNEREELVCEKKSGEVIKRELLLIPFLCCCEPASDAPRVIYEGVKASAAVIIQVTRKLFRDAEHFTLLHKVRSEADKPPLRTFCHYILLCPAAALFIVTYTDHHAAPKGQSARGSIADTRCGAGYYYRFHINPPYLTNQPQVCQNSSAPAENCDTTRASTENTPNTITDHNITVRSALLVLPLNCGLHGRGGSMVSEPMFLCHLTLALTICFRKAKK
jgi:hypothetical protein